MIRWLVFSLILSASGATAEVIGLRSGEHDSFTRLVLGIPAGRNWQLGRTTSGYIFGSGASEDTFDLTQAFDRIPRDRISAIKQAAEPGMLDIELACVCYATAFLWRPNQLVIDIVDGQAPENASFETKIHTTSEPIATPRLVLPIIISNQSYDMSSTSDPVFSQSGIIDSPAIVPPEQVGDEVLHIADAERAIVESFARAASQGALDVAPQMAETEAIAGDQTGVDFVDMYEIAPENGEVSDVINGERHTDEHSEVDPSGLAAFELFEANSERPGITTQTSLDRPSGLARALESTGPNIANCLDEEILDTENWGDDRDFSIQIAELIGGLTTEFDAYPEGAIEALARNFLYFGFGQEAIQTLSLDGKDSQERRAMVSMARVIEDERDPSGLFASQLGCENSVSIWVTLARGTLTDSSERERTATAIGFSGLPPMLRGHLGARLSQIFLDFGDPETAETILIRSLSDQVASNTQAALTSADIALETIGAASAIMELTTLANEDARLTPAGLVELFNLTIAEGQLVQPELIALAATMQFENRGMPIAAELIDVQARALTANDAFSAVFELLNEDTSPLHADLVLALRAEAVLALTSRAADPEFLSFAFRDLPATNSSVVEDAVAARLIRLGFAERAQVILSSTEDQVTNRNRRYLRAEIAVATGENEAVGKLLEGLNDPRAIAIRTQALAAMGDFEAAASTEESLPGILHDDGATWRAGNWDLLLGSDDPLLRAASGAVLADPSVTDNFAPLASGRDLLDEASQTRDLASRLLERFSVVPTPLTETAD